MMCFMLSNKGLNNDLKLEIQQQTYAHLDDSTSTSQVPSHDEYCSTYISFTVQGKYNNFEYHMHHDLGYSKVYSLRLQQKHCI